MACHLEITPGCVAGLYPRIHGEGQDGDIGLRSVYGLHIRPSLNPAIAVMYKAAYDKKLDVIKWL